MHSKIRTCQTEDSYADVYYRIHFQRFYKSRVNHLTFQVKVNILTFCNEFIQAS